MAAAHCYDMHGQATIEHNVSCVPPQVMELRYWEPELCGHAGEFHSNDAWATRRYK